MRQLPDTLVSPRIIHGVRGAWKWQHLQLSSFFPIRLDISPWSPKEVTQLPTTRKLTLPAQNCCLFLVQLKSAQDPTFQCRGRIDSSFSTVSGNTAWENDEPMGHRPQQNIQPCILTGRSHGHHPSKSIFRWKERKEGHHSEHICPFRFLFFLERKEGQDPLFFKLKL